MLCRAKVDRKSFWLRMSKNSAERLRSQQRIGQRIKQPMGQPNEEQSLDTQSVDNWKGLPRWLYYPSAILKQPLVRVLVLLILSCHPQPHGGGSTVDGLTPKWRVVPLPLPPWTCIAAYSEWVSSTVSLSFLFYFSKFNPSGRFLKVTLNNWFLTCSGTISLRKSP